MRKIKVGYLGPGTNTFGYQALQKFFAGKGFKNIEAVAFTNHSEVCLAVGNMEVDYGVVAIENVIDGVVAETIRAIESVDSHLGLKIWGEVILSIELFYMSKSGDESLVKKLLSHPTAIGQCRKLVSMLQERGIPIEVQPSTSRGAELASSDSEVAALASKVALRNFGLKLIRKESVTDYKNSATRFWVLGKEHARLGEDTALKFKTCFLANLEQTASGVLHKTLGVFAEKGISVLLVYPSPILGKKWEYTFVLEVGGHVSESRMIEAWEDFRKLGISLLPLRFLGSYLDTTSG
ncbi:MAG: prephenate dehydratase domain-containing protein [Patescibacteria group bacterium]